jgi:small subunit ribosomal protein S4
MARYTGADCKRCRREKMKLFLKGVLERQFRGYYEEANRRQGKTGENLLRILESRLDNVVYRAGFAASRDMARQLVRHGHIQVNGKKVDIPSYRVSENDIVEVRKSSLELTPFVIARATAGERPVPAWLEVLPSKMRILVHSLPARQVIDTPVQEQLIVELYSK